MLYATHKAGGCLAALVGYEILKQKGLLISGLEDWMQLIILYPAASFGSTYPDLDHHWGSVKEHTPFSFLVHKILHLTKPKHRSWQTHCWVLSALLCSALLLLLYSVSALNLPVSTQATSLLRLIFMGFMLGLGSHLFLDTFTRQGTWLIPGIHFRLVPNSPVFSTGTKYESVVRCILYIACGLALIWVLNPFDIQALVKGVFS